MVQYCVVYEKIRKRWRNLFFARLGVLNWRHNRSQSPVFGLAVKYPTGSEIWCFWYIKTRERKIVMEKTFLLYLSVHWRDLIEQIKKSCHIYTLTRTFVLSVTTLEWTCPRGSSRGYVRGNTRRWTSTAAFGYNFPANTSCNISKTSATVSSSVPNTE